MTHGTRSNYRNGCRCDQCRAANAAYDRERRARAGLPNHGKRSTYIAGCRCDACKEANNTYKAKYRSGAAKPRAATVAKLEDLAFLLSVGEHPERAAARVGWTVDTAQTMLLQHRPDIEHLMAVT